MSGVEPSGPETGAGTILSEDLSLIGVRDSLYSTPRSTKVLDPAGIYDSPRASRLYDVPKSSLASLVEPLTVLYDTPPPSRAVSDVGSVSTINSQTSGLHYSVHTNGRTDIYSRPSLRTVNKIIPAFFFFGLCSY